MARRVATVGDLVRYTCIVGDKVVNGVGTITEGSPDIRAEGSRLARHNDPVDCGPCGIGHIVASAKNKANKLAIARINDTVTLPTGSGTIVTAVSTVSSD